MSFYAFFMFIAVYLSIGRYGVGKHSFNNGLRVQVFESLRKEVLLRREGIKLLSCIFMDENQLASFSLQFSST